MIRIQITEIATHDIEENFDWWSKNRSRRQAHRWYLTAFEAMQSISKDPRRCPIVSERQLSLAGIRELHFGIGKRPTHRMIYYYDEDQSLVTILRVRHHAEDSLYL